MPPCETIEELSTAVLDIKIQAATVDTGSGMKDGKLKSKDFCREQSFDHVSLNEG
jgi:polyisoprenoid-binding protein YceI